MQIKTTMKYHLIPVRLSIIKKIYKWQVLAKMWRKGLVGVQNGAATIENSMELFQKIKNGSAL